MYKVASIAVSLICGVVLFICWDHAQSKELESRSSTFSLKALAAFLIGAKPVARRGAGIAAMRGAALPHIHDVSRMVEGTGNTRLRHPEMYAPVSDDAVSEGEGFKLIKEPSFLAKLEESAHSAKDRGDATEEKRFMQEIIDVKSSTLGPEHPDVLTSKYQLALAMQSSGDYKGAETLQRDVLEARKRTLGPTYPDTLASKMNLALILQALGNAKEALQLQEEILQANSLSNQPGLEDRTQLGTLNVPRLGVGTIAWGLRGFGGLADKAERTLLKSSGASNLAEPVLLASTMKGVNFFDTAERYGNSISTAIGLGYGETEDLMGRMMAADQLNGIVATKFTPSPFRVTAESVVTAAEASRKRLGVKKIDLYQIQMPDIVQPAKRIPGAPESWGKPKDEMYWDGMVQAYKRGIIANVGVSNYGPTLLRKAHAYFKSKGVPLVSNQINYSLLYRKRGAQKAVDVGNELGIKTLAYYPLAMGALTGKWKSSEGDVQENFQTADTLLSSQTGVGPVGEPLNSGLSGKTTVEQLDIAAAARQAIPVLTVLGDIARKRGKTEAQVALNWVICKGAIPIAGARTAKQLIQNTGALGWRLTGEEVEKLDAAADLVDEEFTGAGFKRSNSKFVGYGFETWELD